VPLRIGPLPHLNVTLLIRERRDLFLEYIVGNSRAMVQYANRRTFSQPLSEKQRKFLEMLRDVGPRDNAQSAAIRKSTKRACHVRAWAAWKYVDGDRGLKAWHITDLGRNALDFTVRHARPGMYRLLGAQPPSPAMPIGLIAPGGAPNVDQQKQR
jgi:hypothetical protein